MLIEAGGIMRGRRPCSAAPRREAKHRSGWLLGGLSSAAAVSLIVAGWTGPVSAASPSTSSARHVVPAGELGGKFTTASVKSAEEVLAQSGIATVASETS